MGRDALRTCRGCGKEAHTLEELELFVTQKTGKHGRLNRCKECANEKQKKDWRNPSDPRKARQIERMYQCTLEEYNKRMSSSDNCEVCGTNDDLVYDHCHDTMRFRGVLCRKCNRSIGQLGDDLDSILKVVTYLQKPIDL
jgi:hypothetical protein